MFNARKPGSNLSKFDKKMYDFEKKKQMIEELRNKEKLNQKEKEKALKDKEINSKFIKQGASKINTDIKKIHVDDPGSSKILNTVNKNTTGIVLDKKDKQKIPHINEEEKLSNTLLKFESPSELINTTIPNQSKDKIKVELNRSNTIDVKEIQNQTDIIKFEDENEESYVNHESSQQIKYFVDDKKQIENPSNDIVAEEISSERKLSSREKNDKDDQPTESILTDSIRESNHTPKSPSLNNNRGINSTEKISIDSVVDPKIITIVFSPQACMEGKKLPKEPIMDELDDYTTSKKSSNKIFIVSNKKISSEKIEIKNTEILSTISSNQVNSQISNSKNKEQQKDEKTEIVILPHYNQQTSPQKTGISQIPTSNVIGKKTTEIKQDLKKEVKKETRRDFKKDEKKEVKRDESKRLPDKNGEKLKNHIIESIKEIKEDKKEILPLEIPKEENEKLSDNVQNRKQDTALNNFMDNSKAEATSKDVDFIYTKKSLLLHKKSRSQLKVPIVEDFPDDHSKIEDNAENFCYETERDVYNMFLYESVPNEKEPLQLLLNDQMKNIIHNMKDRKKEIETVKVDKKKQIIENLGRINDSTISKDRPKSTREIIIEHSYNNSFFNQSEVKKDFQTRDLSNLIEDSFLNRNYFKKSSEKDNNKVEIIKDSDNDLSKKDIAKNKTNADNQDDIINPSEVSSVHLSINTDTTKLRKKKSITIDFEDYLKENIDDEETIRLETNPNVEYQGETENVTKLYNNIVKKMQTQADESRVEKTHLTMADDSIMNSKNRSDLLVFGDYENPHEYEEKIKKLEKLREKKMKNMEKKKEDSKVKISVTDITNENNSIDSKAITEREKSSNSKKIKISSVKSEDITDVIYVPSKKPSHAINYENTHVSVHHQRIIATSYSQKQDNNKYLSSRSKSQLPHYEQLALKNKQPYSFKSEKFEIKKKPNERIPLFKVVRKEPDSSTDNILKDYLVNKTPKYMVSYNKLSNKKTIKSAIKTVCLAAEPHRACREKILEIIESCSCENFIILFKGNFGRFDLKAVYTYNTHTNKTELVTSLSPSPDILDSHMIQIYYKYDLIQKEFKILSDTKEISIIVDAVAITNNR